MRELKVIFLLSVLCCYAGAECNYDKDPWYLTIICRNTSNEDYILHILQFIHNENYQTNSHYLTIVDSNFPTIQNLINPLDLVQFTSQDNNEFYRLKISSCHIKTIKGDAFKNFQTIKELDLSFNLIEDVEFISYLPASIRELKLNHNKITFINLKKLAKNVELLDLSFNRLTEIDFSIPLYNTLINKQVVVTKTINVESNNITTINMLPIFEGFIDLDVNIANNPLKYVKNCNPVLDGQFNSNISTIDLSNSLSTLSLANITTCKLKFISIIANNNKIILDKSLDSSYFKHLSFSNSSLTYIARHIFQNLSFKSLNLSYNNLEYLNQPVFVNTNIRGPLDLSHCNIKQINNTFQDLYVFYLNLEANNITELNPDSFGNIRKISFLDLTFNINLKLTNDSFRGCSTLRQLNLANSNISIIEAGAFNELSLLQSLWLENNSLTHLKSNVFKPLLIIFEIYLQNNKLTSLQSELFNSIPQIMTIKLSTNNIEFIESNAFHNLTNLETLEISDNKAPLTIEESAFSDLIAYRVDLRESGLSAINSNMFSGNSNSLFLDLRDNRIESLNFSRDNELNIEQLDLSVKGNLKSKSFIGLKKLESLTFWNSQIETVESRAFQGLFNLKSLEFKNSTVRTLESGALDGLFNLEHLNMQNVLKNTGFLSGLTFTDLKSLQHLNLSNEALNNIDCNAFKGLKILQNLYLNDNNLSSLNNLTFFGLKHLEFLDLSSNNFVVLERHYFRDLEDLKTLNLSYNKINVIELGTFQHFPHLESLILKKNNLTEFKVGTFSNLYNLLTLDLSQNNLSNLLFESFLPLKSLTHLNIEFNNLKTFGEFSLISNLPQLKWIGIGKNKWQCDYLEKMLITFRRYILDYSSSNFNYYDDNVEGIDCIDICKYLLCLKDSHGIN